MIRDALRQQVLAGLLHATAVAVGLLIATGGKSEVFH